MKEKENVFSVELLRVVSICAVVLIHTSTRVLEFTHYDLAAFPFALFLNQVARFAVPMFFMISGFVLETSYKEGDTYLEFLKKRLNRVLVPYVFWSFIYYVFVYQNQSKNFFEILFTGEASYQLYFIPTLLIFYFIFPPLHKSYKFISKWFFLLIFGVVELSLLNQDYFVNNLPYPYPISVFLFNFYVFILGMVAAHSRGRIKKILGEIKYLLFFSGATLAYFIYKQGRQMYFETYNINSFYSQWRPLVLIYTIIVSGILLYIYSQRTVNHYTIKKLARYSFFVFFIHTLILEIAWKYWAADLFAYLKWTEPGKIIFDIIFFGTVAYASFFFAYLAHKFPKLIKLTG